MNTLIRRIYVPWLVAVLAISFYKDGLNENTITRLLIIGILVISLAVFRLWHPIRSGRFYILSSTFLAAFVEAAYMISKPVRNYLKVDIAHFDWNVFLHNYAIDLALTVPVYLFIFWVIWKLINHFAFTKWEYIFFIGLGQALGDGNAFFLISPAALLLVPYVMLNYHAANVAPYLTIQGSLDRNDLSRSRRKYIVALAAIIIAYLVGGACIRIVASSLGLPE